MTDAVGITRILPGFFSLLDYGADPDGNRDCRDAFINVLEAADRGGIIIIPPGSYRLAAHVEWGAVQNVTIWKQARTFFPSTGQLPADDGNNRVVQIDTLTVSTGGTPGGTGPPGPTGPSGPPGAQGTSAIRQYRNAATKPDQPTGGSYNVTNGTLTPSTGWYTIADLPAPGAGEETWFVEDEINPATQADTVTPDWSVVLEAGGTGPAGPAGPASTTPGPQGLIRLRQYRNAATRPGPPAADSSYVISTGVLTPSTDWYAVEDLPQPTAAESTWFVESEINPVTAADTSTPDWSVVLEAGGAEASDTEAWAQRNNPTLIPGGKLREARNVVPPFQDIFFTPAGIADTYPDELLLHIGEQVTTRTLQSLRVVLAGVSLLYTTNVGGLINGGYVTVPISAGNKAALAGVTAPTDRYKAGYIDFNFTDASSHQHAVFFVVNSDTYAEPETIDAQARAKADANEAAIAQETAQREARDTAHDSALAQETAARQAEDTSLSNRIDQLADGGDADTRDLVEQSELDAITDKLPPLVDARLEPDHIEGAAVADITGTYELIVSNPDTWISGALYYEIWFSGVQVKSRAAWSRTATTIQFPVTETQVGSLANLFSVGDDIPVEVQFYTAPTGTASLSHTVRLGIHIDAPLDTRPGIWRDIDWTSPLTVNSGQAVPAASVTVRASSSAGAVRIRAGCNARFTSVTQGNYRLLVELLKDGNAIAAQTIGADHQPNNDTFYLLSDLETVDVPGKTTNTVYALRVTRQGENAIWTVGGRRLIVEEVRVL